MCVSRFKLQSLGNSKLVYYVAHTLRAYPPLKLLEFQDLYNKMNDLVLAKHELELLHLLDLFIFKQDCIKIAYFTFDWQKGLINSRKE